MVNARREPGGTSVTIAGSSMSKVTGAESSMEIRMGATKPAGKRTRPWSSTIRSAANTVAPSVGRSLEISIRARGAPTMLIDVCSGSDTNVAICCPSPRSALPPTWLSSEPIAPSPGTEEIAAGIPPAGVRICCFGPASGIELFVLPSRPGYSAALCTSNVPAARSLRAEPSATE